MLLLLQRIFWEGPVLMLLYLVVNHLYNASLTLEDLSSRSRILPIIKFLNSCSLWSSFRWSSMRNFSEGPVLSIEPFHKTQHELIYLPDVVRKNEKSPYIVQIYCPYLDLFCWMSCVIETFEFCNDWVSGETKTSDP